MAMTEDPTVKLAKGYLAANAAESGADEVIKQLIFRVGELTDQWSIMARACGNWRTFSNQVETDHDHPDWQAASRAILERDNLRNSLKDMMSAVRVFHGPVAWDIYENNAPEMKRAREALGL